MRKNLSKETIERYSKMYGLERKTYLKIFKESDKHLIKRITLKANEIVEVPTSELMDKLLSNPRIENISINIERVGDVEQTHITANLKS